MCLHPRGMTMDVSPYKQQLHRHPGTTAATPPPTLGAKSSHSYTVVPSYLWALGIKSTTQNLSLTYKLEFKSNYNQIVHIFDTYPTKPRSMTYYFQLSATYCFYIFVHLSLQELNEISKWLRINKVDANKIKKSPNIFHTRKITSLIQNKVLITRNFREDEFLLK